MKPSRSVHERRTVYVTNIFLLTFCHFFATSKSRMWLCVGNTEQDVLIWAQFLHLNFRRKRHCTVARARIFCDWETMYNVLKSVFFKHVFQKKNTNWIATCILNLHSLEFTCRYSSRSWRHAASFWSLNIYNQSCCVPSSGSSSRSGSLLSHTGDFGCNHSWN